MQIVRSTSYSGTSLPPVNSSSRHLRCIQLLLPFHREERTSCMRFPCFFSCYSLNLSEDDGYLPHNQAGVGSDRMPPRASRELQEPLGEPSQETDPFVQSVAWGRRPRSQK